MSERPALPVADPAPLGLAAFALTTFVLSAHNAGWAPDLAWIGLALFYGGTVQLLAGMWEFKNRNTFGATAFSTYGGFWLALATFVLLDLFGKLGGISVTGALGWFLLAFAIFNAYMLIASTRVNMAVFLVFLTLQITEVVLFLGFFSGSTGLIQIGGYFGILTAVVAWYTSFAGVVNSTASHNVIPVGGPMWSERGIDSAPQGRIASHGV